MLYEQVHTTGGWIRRCKFAALHVYICTCVIIFLLRWLPMDLDMCMYVHSLSLSTKEASV